MSGSMEKLSVGAEARDENCLFQRFCLPLVHPVQCEWESVNIRKILIYACKKMDRMVTEVLATTDT
jgi:hypothetical protein